MALMNKDHSVALINAIVDMMIRTGNIGIPILTVKSLIYRLSREEGISSSEIKELKNIFAETKEDEGVELCDKVLTHYLNYAIYETTRIKYNNESYYLIGNERKDELRLQKEGQHSSILMLRKPNQIIIFEEKK